MNDIDLIRNNLDIELLLDYFEIEFKPLGDELQFLCPFHDEKTPSMFFNKIKDMFHCFGCGESGDSIEFVKRILDFNFKDALTFLKEFIRQPKANVGNRIYRQVKVQKLKLDSVFLIHKELYPDYLKERNILLETATYFELGFCFSGDFKDRIIIPVKKDGKVIDYLGRSIREDQKVKYLNLGSVNEVLYNDTGSKEVYITEGVFDVFRMYQADIKNCIATFGSVLTPKQKSLLYKKERIVVVPDNDKGGDFLVDSLKDFSNLNIARLPSQFHDAGESPIEVLQNLKVEKYNNSISINKIGVVRK